MFSRMAIAPIAAVLVLAGVASASADTGVTTQNVRVGLPAWQARHDIRHAARFGSVVLAQEMHKRRAAAFAPAHWGTAQATRARVRNRGDCAIYWRRDRWRLRRAYVVPVTRGVTRNETRYAQIAVLTGRQTMAAVCVHMPTARAPTAVYRAGIGRIRALLGRLARFPHVVIGGDWNRAYSRRPRLPGYVAGRPPRGVDYVYARRPDTVSRVRVIRPTFSDHNGIRTWVRDG